MNLRGKNLVRLKQTTADTTIGKQRPLRRSAVVKGIGLAADRNRHGDFLRDFVNAVLHPEFRAVNFKLRL